MSKKKTQEKTTSPLTKSEEKALEDQAAADQELDDAIASTDDYLENQKAKAEQEKAPAKPPVKLVDKLMRVALTDAENKQYAIQLSGQLREAAMIEREMASFKANCNARTKAVEARIGELQTLINDQFEMRNIVCEETMDFARRKVVTRRTDTGETTERDMMAWELQQELPLDTANEPTAETQQPEPDSEQDAPFADDLDDGTDHAGEDADGE